ncbi:MAG: hypothetical protein IPK60_07680 [Sandaracinaceae bacterium]|nr:hypothetical protein [Sandaracinaceae bacterium]
MSETVRLPPKKDVARALLLRGSVFVHLDPRIAEVSVPDFLRTQPQLVLQIGLDLPVPIPDLRVDDAGVFGTLSFARSPHSCVVPWNAVFALVGDDGKGMVWPNDMPAEIAAEVDMEKPKPKPMLNSISRLDKINTKPRVQKTRPSRAPSLSEPPTVSARPNARRSSNPATARSASSSSSAASSSSIGSTSARPSARPNASPSAQPRKPRELPPYLRVIK